MQVTMNLDISNAKAIALLNYIRTLEFVTLEETKALSDIQKQAIDLGIDALENGKSISQKKVLNETKKKYPHLFK
jgi:hypothetical protein